MNIPPLSKYQAYAPSAGALEKSGNVVGTEFSKLLENSVGEVNDLLNKADEKSVELATGKTENLHEAMIGFEKAESAFKLLVQVRNKALEAYNEILRMQV